MNTKQTNTSLIESPIFIVGPGRSGTTLVRKILSAHSRISILPETQFIKWADERANVQGTPKDFDAFWKEYTSWIRFTYLGIDPAQCLDFINQKRDQTIQSVFRSVLTVYGENSGKVRIGEKSPSHVRYIPVLLDWFPNCRIIIMQRDPRAVIASRLGTPWVRNRISTASLRTGIFTHSRLFELIFGAKNWSNIFENIVPEWQSDSRIHIVPYEKLVQNPKNVVQSICHFIGEIYEKDMMTRRNSESTSVSSEKDQEKRVKQWKKHHSKTNRPISADSLGKWKKNLSSTEIAMIEGICIKGMRKCGYTSHISNTKRWGGLLLTQAHIAAEHSERISRSALQKLRSIIS